MPDPSKPQTASVAVTITTNSNPGNASVTNISADCYDSSGAKIPDRSFSGMGNSALENFANVATNCPVKFVWNETYGPAGPAGTTVTCTSFTISFQTTGSPPAPGGPFANATYTSPSTPLTSNSSNPPQLLSANIVNSGQTWTYAGTITTKVDSNTPVTLNYDPEIEVDTIG